MNANRHWRKWHLTMRLKSLAGGMILLLALLTGGTAPASAHAVILESVPAPNTTISASVLEIRLRFNSRIDHRRSRLTLRLPDGKTVPVMIAEDSEPAIVAGQAASLSRGIHALIWQVLAVDGHISRGEIPFTIGK
ncbi:putative Copper resistance protein, copC family [Azospirillaceae bacterium]